MGAVIDGLIPAEIRAEGAAIRATVEACSASARDVASALRSGGVRRLYLVGDGTSLHSALAAAALHRRTATASEPLAMALPAGEFRHYPPALGPGDALVGISASGEFRDILAVVDELRGRIPTVGVVHVPGSTLDGAADHVVRSAGGPSRVPVMTMTFVATLAATHVLLAELLGGDRGAAVRRAVLAAADHVDAAVAAAEPRVEALAALLGGYEHVHVVGSGVAAHAALEAALKLKEIAIVHAEGAESWEMASGAATIVGPGSVVVALAPHGPGREATLEVARHASEWGARIVEVGPGERPAIAGADHLPLPDEAAEDLAPLTTVAPIALLAFSLARRRGLDPDRPGWVERYHRQGLRHIVGT